MAAPTLTDALGPALDAYAELTELAEDVDDEWTYITDLTAAWRDRLEALEAARGGEPVDSTVVDALAAVADEARAVEDPHRAIDWLSTYPQVVLLALGEQP
jgi:hypothetical protein